MPMCPRLPPWRPEEDIECPDLLCSTLSLTEHPHAGVIGAHGHVQLYVGAGYLNSSPYACEHARSCHLPSLLALDFKQKQPKLGLCSFNITQK